MRKPTVVLFSAGSLIRDGTLANIMGLLSEHGIECTDWKSLFAHAKDQTSIHLLPNLIKKIPTFDFALILCDGIDTVIPDGGAAPVPVMRDNVLFEIGLCIMGLGRNRVVLLTNQEMHLPEDLYEGSELGVKQIIYHSRAELQAKVHDLAQSMEREPPLLSYINDIVSHIHDNQSVITPVFIGAAISSAESYFKNFILRVLEHSDQEVSGPEHQVFPFPDRFELKIILPSGNQIVRSKNLSAYYDAHGLERYEIKYAGTRSLSFRARRQDGLFQIVDIPTSVTASYGMVDAIMHLEADELEDDRQFQDRFIEKEMDVYEYALRLMTDPKHIEQRICFIDNEDARAQIRRTISNTKICREVL